MFFALLGCTDVPLPDPADHDLQSYFDAFAEDGFAGTVLVTQGDDVLLADASGTCRRPDVACARDTVYDIGSLTKQFTAAGIMALADRGVLTPDDLVTRWVELPDDKAHLTLHDLMTHTSGILDPSLLRDYAKITRDDVIDTISRRSLQPDASPTGYSYANHNYSLLGAILEIETGLPYEEALQDLVFAPAGLSETGYLLPSWPDERIAQGRHAWPARWKTPLEFDWDDDGPWWNLRANGGLLSTVDDLFAWHRALRDHTALTADAVDASQTPYVREFEDGSTFYGYGWVVSDTDAGPEVWHDGGNGIFYAMAIRYPDSDLGVFFASNDERDDDWRLPWGLSSIVTRDFAQ
ncbi:MAG: beta-lactamase family protein [Myxococcales bacterium]|nr:beta-lactamase family protein [Myxococcales bacterium]